MNLHIVVDNKFINNFHDNLKELNIDQNNKIVVRSSNSKFLYIDRELPFAKLYSRKFEILVGDTYQYDHVFIHLFAPVMYRWVARHKFKSLSWMVWGADLYNLPFINYNFYEKITLKRYVSGSKSLNAMLYHLKVKLLNMPFKRIAYSKISHVFTWMTTEYNFAKGRLPELRADHKFFFYENQVPYQKLDDVINSIQKRGSGIARIIIGNAGSPTLNHLDAIDRLMKTDVKANIYIPVSYGVPDYIEFLRAHIVYTNGTIEFIDKFMNFDDYVEFLSGADALIMDSIRPQGYGNVLMMLYLGKKVFLNDKNISIQDLESHGIATQMWKDIQNIHMPVEGAGQTRAGINSLMSHEKLAKIYREYFG